MSIISDKESTVGTALEMGLEHDSVGNSSVRLFLTLIDSFSAEGTPAEMRLESGKGQMWQI